MIARAAATSRAAEDLTDGGFCAHRAPPDGGPARERPAPPALHRQGVLGAGGARAPRSTADDLAIGRVDLLDPLPLDEILGMVRSHPNLEKLYWVQEEPENMGAWAHVQRRIGRNRPYEVSWEYICICPAGPARPKGDDGSHVIEQGRVLREALSTSPAAQEFVARARPHLTEPNPAAPPAGGADGVAVEPAPARDGVAIANR